MPVQLYYTHIGNFPAFAGVQLRISLRETGSLPLFPTETAFVAFLRCLLMRNFSQVVRLSDRRVQIGTQGSANVQDAENLVGLSGLEPPTSRLSGVRSNRLSYRPIQVVSSLFSFSVECLCTLKNKQHSPLFDS